MNTVPRGTGGKPIPKYPIGGGFGELSARQAHERYGVNPSTFLWRWKQGVRGEELLSPPRFGRPPGPRRESYRTRKAHTPNSNGAGSTNGAAFIAARIAKRHPDRAPPVQDLIDYFGMHRSTAHRWRAAFLAAGMKE